jgi:hypothetical protein
VGFGQKSEAEMNQEQLLDNVAELLKTEAERGPGTLLLVHENDFKIYHLSETLETGTVVLGVFSVDFVKGGLSPSTWLGLAKKVWACKSAPTASIKFPGQTSAGGGKHGHKPKPTDESPEAS